MTQQDFLNAARSNPALTHLSDSQLKDAVARIWQMAGNAWMGERAMTTESDVQLAVELAIDNGAFDE